MKTPLYRFSISLAYVGHVRPAVRGQLVSMLNQAFHYSTEPTHGHKFKSHALQGPAISNRTT